MIKQHLPQAPNNDGINSAAKDPKDDCGEDGVFDVDKYGFHFSFFVVLAALGFSPMSVKWKFAQGRSGVTSRLVVLYKCLVKLGTTKEKRLMINIIAL